MLKLEELKPEVLKRIQKIDKEKLVKYAEELKASKNYNNFATRFANDVKRACFSCAEICSWYDKYNCHDTHITSLFVSVLKQYIKENQLNIII